LLAAKVVVSFGDLVVCAAAIRMNGAMELNEPAGISRSPQSAPA
jgi:hypothetical protein